MPAFWKGSTLLFVVGRLYVIDLYDILVERERNGGKGAAVRDGLRKATGDYVLFQDADLEYDPAQYGALLTPVDGQNADVVIGSRFLAPAYVRVHYFWHLKGKRSFSIKCGSYG